MKKLAYLLVLSMALVTLSCNSIQPLGYFYSEIYVKPSTKAYDESLQIELHEDIQDRFYVEGVGVRKMPIVHFRKTVENISTNTFSANFKEVKVIDFESEKEVIGDDLRLVIYRIKPYWKVSSVGHSNVIVDGYSVPQRVPLSAIAFDVRSSLYQGDTLVEEIDFTAISEAQMSHRRHAADVFKDGFMKVQEQLQKEIVRIQRGKIAGNQINAKDSSGE